MHTMIYSALFYNAMATAVCWTLLHSLWIGLMCALAAAVFMGFTRRSKPSVRYGFMLFLLLVFVLGTAAAGIVEFNQARSISAPVQETTGAGFTPGFTGNLVYHPAAAFSLTGKIKTIIDQQAALLVICWLLVACWKMVQLAAGMLTVKRIRKQAAVPSNAHLHGLLRQTAAAMRIRKKVMLLELASITQPFVTGWLKPVIFLPASVVTSLSTAQLESILMHELAHIRRNDYLVNLLQQMLELLFFFNPALCWLSRLIRAEREACCDEMVIGKGDRRHYLDALMIFGEASIWPATISVTAGYGLRERITRMLKGENRSLRPTEKLALAAGLVMAALFFIDVQSKGNSSDRIRTTQPARQMVTIKPAVAVSPLVANEIKRALPHRLTNDTLPSFKSILFDHGNEDLGNCSMRLAGSDGHIYHVVVTNGRITALEIDQQAIDARDLNRYQPIVAQVAAQMAMKRHRPEADELARIKQADAGGAEKRKKEVTNFRKDSGVFDKAAMASNEKWKYPAGENTIAGDVNRVRIVLNALVDAHVVSSADAVEWFGLTEDQLIVNGQPQDAALMQSLRDKTGVRKDFGLYYGPVKMTGIGVFMDKADLAK